MCEKEFQNRNSEFCSLECAMNYLEI